MTLITSNKLLSEETDKHKQRIGMHNHAASHSSSSQRLTVLMYISQPDISLVWTTCSGFIMCMSKTIRNNLNSPNQDPRLSYNLLFEI